MSELTFNFPLVKTGWNLNTPTHTQNKTKHVQPLFVGARWRTENGSETIRIGFFKDFIFQSAVNILEI